MTFNLMNMFGDPKNEERQPINTEQDRITVTPNQRVPAATETTNNMVSSSNDHKRAVGAGVTTGICGFCLGGPVVGTAVGIGTGYAAQNDSGPVGNAARKVGDFSLRVEDRARKFEHERHYLEQSNNFLVSVWSVITKKVDDCVHVCVPRDTNTSAEESKESTATPTLEKSA